MAQFIWHSIRNDISRWAPGVKGHSLFLSWARDRVGGRLAVKQLAVLIPEKGQQVRYPSITYPPVPEQGGGCRGCCGPSNVLWLELAPFT